MRKKLLVLVALIATMMLAVTGCGGGKPEINLTDYVTVEFKGADGHGEAIVGFDYTQFEKDCVGDDDNDISAEELEALMPVSKFETTITYELDKADELSNGDKITVNVSYDKDLADDVNAKFKGTQKEFTVTGLVEGTKPLSVFTEENFAYEGNVISAIDSSDGRVHIGFWEARFGDSGYCVDIYGSFKDEELKDVTFTIANDGAFQGTRYQVGDEVTIIATLPDNMINEGYYIEDSEFTFTIDPSDSGTAKPVALESDEIAFLENKALESIEENKAYTLSYTDESGAMFWPETANSTDTELVGLYRAEHQSEGVIYVAIGRIHFTSESDSSQNTLTCDKDLYVPFYAYGVGRPVSEEFYGFSAQQYTGLSLEEVLNSVESSEGMNSITKIN